MKSIRRALTTTLLLGIGAIIVVSGILLYVVVARHLESEFDTALYDKARVLGSLMEEKLEGYALNLTPEILPEFEGGHEPDYFQIWLPDGRTLARSMSMGKKDLELRPGAATAPMHWDVTLVNKKPGRAVALLRVIPKDDEFLAWLTAEKKRAEDTVSTIMVVRPRRQIDEALASVAWGLTAAAGALCLAVVGLVTLTVRRSLRPLVRMGADVERIDSRSLSTRLPLEGLPVELLSSARTINDLVGRLEDAFGRERRMTANLAHELRTPIAELRTFTEVANRWKDDSELGREALDHAHVISLQMGDLIESILRLARVEAGSANLRREPVELAPLVRSGFLAHVELARPRGVTFDEDIGRGTWVMSDPGLLGVIVGNLLKNAIQHGAPDNSVAVRAREDDTTVRLIVENAAPNLGEGDLQNLTEPFWQKEASRAGGAHSGLGLALTRGIVDLLEAEMTFVLEAGRLRVTLVLPRAKEAADRPQGDPITSPKGHAMGLRD